MADEGMKKVDFWTECPLLWFEQEPARDSCSHLTVKVVLSQRVIASIQCRLVWPGGLVNIDQNGGEKGPNLVVGLPRQECLMMAPERGPKSVEHEVHRLWQKGSHSSCTRPSSRNKQGQKDHHNYISRPRTGSQESLGRIKYRQAWSALREQQEKPMTPTVQVGTVLIGERSPRMTEVLALETEPYLGKWSILRALDGSGAGDKIHAAGWNFFFMAAETKVMFFGAVGARRIQNAVKRILRKVAPQNLNCLEVTGIVAKRFLGVPYATVTAHSRHIQQNCQLGSIESRRAVQRDAEWARG
jgi:hypothetical protein